MVDFRNSAVHHGRGYAGSLSVFFAGLSSPCLGRTLHPSEDVDQRCTVIKWALSPPFWMGPLKSPTIFRKFWSSRKKKAGYGAGVHCEGAEADGGHHGEVSWHRLGAAQLCPQSMKFAGQESPTLAPESPER